MDSWWICLTFYMRELASHHKNDSLWSPLIHLKKKTLWGGGISTLYLDSLVYRIHHLITVVRGQFVILLYLIHHCRGSTTPPPLSRYDLGGWTFSALWWHWPWCNHILMTLLCISTFKSGLPNVFEKQQSRRKRSNVLSLTSSPALPPKKAELASDLLLIQSTI